MPYSFMLYPAAVRADRLLARLRGGRSTRRGVRELCEAHGIEYINTGNVNSPEVAARLEAADLDFIVIYWFDQIIRERVIAAPKRAVINVHAAYLPHCRGLFPTLFSALEPGTPFGISAHLIENREIDAGPVLAQRTTVPPAGRSVLFNDSWVNRAGVGILDEVLSDFDRLLDEARPQPEGGSYYSYPERNHMEQARRTGLKLVTLRDFLSVVRGTGATDADGHRPGLAPTADVDAARHQ
ncbi:formyl transferase domain-containing protein [Streptomyces zinciresistens K42]|uniref:Formyl transferase domain-containing protein n=2 Tax=Streptomyces TaxID=1883 RepID=G2G607_9ACTN|nr:formyl transferase domain-containing protein [Streptomyces zinciresistens K42]